MDIQAIILLTIFISAFLAITLEHITKVNKSWIALFAGSLMWVVVTFGKEADAMHDSIIHTSAEIFELIIFLMGAMTVVEMLGHFRFFTWLEIKLRSANIENTTLFWIMGIITFFSSAVLDNLTTTLVMIQIGRHLPFKKENFNYFIVNTVIAANAGGAMSPVGDVTTIMIWLAGKFTAWEIVAAGILPSLVGWVIPQYMITKKLTKTTHEAVEYTEMMPLQWGIIILGFSTFGLAVIVNAFHLPPFFGILFGLGISAIVIDWKLKRGSLHIKANRIVNVIKEIDMATINFFVGILLAVGALQFHGTLGLIAGFIFGDDPANNPVAVITGHISLGVLSSIFDNVPLTAAVLQMITVEMDYIYWVLLAITAGMGGSLTSIGSAAGVAAMGQVESLTFVEYLKKGTIPALFGYIGAILTWFLLFY
ncbi:MAG: sodium:proton antiporter NhaD [Bacteroidota bacterium]